MRLVPLDDDRTARGQRGGRIATGDGEREREVARPEDGDRADRHQLQPKVGARQWSALRQRWVEAHAAMVTLPSDAGEQPQLTGSARELTGDARLRQAALGDRGRDDRLPLRLDRGSDPLQEVGALGRRRRTVDPERLRRRARGLLHLISGDEPVVGAQRPPRRRSAGSQHTGLPHDLGAGDERVSGGGHGQERPSRSEAVPRRGSRPAMSRAAALVTVDHIAPTSPSGSSPTGWMSVASAPVSPPPATGRLEEETGP